MSNMWSLRLEMASSLSLLLSMLYQKLDVYACLNDEGRALLVFKDRMELDPYGALSNWIGDDFDPCLWFGVECSDDGKVLTLNLKDLCLKGTLAPEIGKLSHMDSLILHNNFLYGVIPGEIGELPVLRVLDLGCNSFMGQLPPNLGSTLSLKVLVLRGNKFTVDIPPELQKLDIDEDFPSPPKRNFTSSLLPVRRDAICMRNLNFQNATIRRLLQLISLDNGKDRKHGKDHALTPSPSPSPSSTTSLPPFPFPFDPPADPPSPEGYSSLGSSSPTTPSDILTPAPALPPATTSQTNHTSETPSPLVVRDATVKHTTSWRVYTSVAVGTTFVLAFSAICVLCYRSKKFVAVRPWSTGLSGQLRKAFVAGLPALKRSELEVACEDFSNIIGSSPNCIQYKGTLSSGVEIAVTSSVVTLAKDWSKESEDQFRKKISVLSKVNHKNFVNLLGFCKEEEPFTRMMVFEYAPNGTLFEHLHIREAEHLDWTARLRIAMGMAYCLEHMHQLDPPVILRTLDSSSIYLTDDFAAKVSDIGFWTEAKEVETQVSGLLDSQISSPEGIVYSVGIILLEMLSGRRPFSEDNGLLVLWASQYLNGKRPLRDMVDPTLDSFREEQVGALCDVIKSCINPARIERPTMTEVARRLREITATPPGGAAPKLSPLWWAELESISAEVA